MKDYKIHVISLEDDRVRRSKLLAGLHGKGLDATVVPAVDGRKLSALEYFRSSINSNYWFNRRHHLTPSELGCFLSHKLSYEMFLETGSDWLVVLEDDVELLPGFCSFLQSGDGDLDISSVYVLGGQEGLNSFRRVILSPFESGLGKRVILSTHRWVYRTCAYAVHRSKIESILSLLNSKRFVIDNWSYFISHTNINNMRYRGDVAHPIDLEGSRIEQERNF